MYIEPCTSRTAHIPADCAVSVMLLLLPLLLPLLLLARGEAGYLPRAACCEGGVGERSGPVLSWAEGRCRRGLFRTLEGGALQGEKGGRFITILQTLRAGGGESRLWHCKGQARSGQAGSATPREDEEGPPRRLWPVEMYRQGDGDG